MAEQDDFKVKITLEADPSKLAFGMDAAKVDAEKKGEETGKAFADGVARGGKSAASATGDHGSGGGSIPTAAAPASPSASPGGGGSLASDLNSTASAASLLISQMDRFAAIGKSIGDAVFEGVKQQLELTQAIRQLEHTLSVQQEMQSDQFAKQARGAGGQPAGKAMLERLQGLEKETQGIDEELAKPFGVGDVLAGAISEITSSGPPGMDIHIESRRDQLREQKKENEAAMLSLRQQQQGLKDVGRRTTTGEAVAEAADFLGIPRAQNLGHVGQSLDPATFHALLRSLEEGNRRVVEVLAQSTGSFAGNQRLINEAVNGSRHEVSR